MGKHTEKYRKQVSLWLLSMCGLVFVMVIVGGLTRLTQSGLSMVEWRPIMGILPPIGETVDRGLENRTLRNIKRSTMVSLSEFKKIFWFEYGHRVLGRLLNGIFLSIRSFWQKKGNP